MKHLLSQTFLKRYPGPYAYLASTDGVDATFCIECTTTGRSLASVYYWDDRIASELIARVVTVLLNEHAPTESSRNDSSTKPLSEHEIAAFFGMYPGPFAVKAFHCDYRGPGIEIACDTSGESALQIYNNTFRGHARLVSNSIARALKLLRQQSAT